MFWKLLLVLIMRSFIECLAVSDIVLNTLTVLSHLIPTASPQSPMRRLREVKSLALGNM